MLFKSITYKTMRIPIFLSLFLLLTPIPTHAESGLMGTKQLFYDANTAYQNGEYQEAIGLYEAALASGHEATLYYNLGNAYFKNGQPGYAAMNYKKALALESSHTDAQANLSFIRQNQQVGTYQGVGWFSYAKMLSLNSWAWLSSVSIWLTMGLLILPRLYGLKRVSVTALTGFSILAVLVSLPALLTRQSETYEGVILEADTMLKVAPTTHSPAVSYLQPGTVALIEKEHPTHYFVEGPRGQEGWVAKESLGKVWE